MANEKKPLGVLIVHGFTGSLDTVRAVVPVAEGLGLPWRMPVLRGHGTRFEDLDGVRYGDWYDDGLAALKELTQEVERVVIVGLSMGGLVALRLAMEHGEHVAGLVLLAPALRFADPLVPLTPLIKIFFRYWDSQNSFSDMELAKSCTNYKKFPTATFGQLLDFGHEIERRLGEVKVPVTTLFSRKDTVIHPIVMRLLEDKLGSRDKQFVYFEKSGHEMLQDCETAGVVAAIEAAVRKHLDGQQLASA
ncbi:MAG: putative lysophospholipase [Cyanobacteria bacterium RYN_339]|nr:putative lysophospholipase [Cyanobacteria bacterium RYN_339]